MVSLTLFVLFSIAFFGSSSDRATSYSEGFSEGARKAADYIPDNLSRQLSDSALNPFRPHAHHPPPQQENSTVGDVSWFTHLKWRNPFSSTVAIDDRAVLPPEVPRTPIYTYYDADLKKNPADRQAEHDLLLTWRRAWWAKGFRPIILGRADAVQNPLYQSMQSLNLESSLEEDLMRWLAWGNMGSGILSNWLAFPMCEYDNDMLKFLRQGGFRQLTRYKNLHNGLFVGDGNKINEAIRSALSSQAPPTGDTLFEALPKTVFKVEPTDDAIAFYSTEVIKMKYKSIYDTLRENSAKGKDTLRQLIESHLQSTWQSLFPHGLAVLRPIPESMTAVTTQANHLAKNLSACLSSPLPSSCPPNIANCRTCMTSQPMVISMPHVYVKKSTLFTIGTVPHPYTMGSLIRKRLVDSSKVIRRETARDSYILAASAEILGTGMSSYDRIVSMKEAVASERGKASSLWMTAERKYDKAWKEDLHWIFGFPMPQEPTDDGKSDTPVPGPERKLQPSKAEFVPAKMPDDKGIKLEHKLLEESKAVVSLKHKNKANRHLKEVIEKWCLADAELWNFVRAFGAQRKMEREKWEEEERVFAGSEKRGTWNRWFGDDE